MGKSLHLEFEYRVVAVSEGVADSAEDYNGRKLSITTVPKGVNHEYYQPGEIDSTFIHEREGIPRDAPVTGTVSVFRKEKHLDRA